MSVLTNWCADEITVVVATSAFGLGVNKADVRHVFHVGIPDSLECWIQEAVRADRDGKKCDATVLYDLNFQILDFYLRGHGIQGASEVTSRFAQVWRFLLTKSCRRIIILQYFGETMDEGTSCETFNANLCDNCWFNKEQPNQVSKSQHFNVVTDAISDLPNHGIQKTCMWICRTSSSKFRAPTQEDVGYGKGRGLSNEYWASLIGKAIGDGLLSFQFTSIMVTGAFKSHIAATLAVTEAGEMVANGTREWRVHEPLESKSSGTTVKDKKRRSYSGGNIMPVIDDALRSSSNWFTITGSAQYQYPGIAHSNPDSSCRQFMGHINDCSQLPHYTQSVKHFLYKIQNIENVML